MSLYYNPYTNYSAIHQTQIVDVQSIYEIIPLYQMGSSQIKNRMLYMIQEHFFYDPDIVSYIDENTFQLRDITGERFTFSWPFDTNSSYHFWYIVMRNYGKEIMYNYRKMNDFTITINKLKQKNRILQMKLKDKKIENEFCQISIDSAKFVEKKIRKIGETEHTNIYVGVEFPKHLDPEGDGNHIVCFGRDIYRI